MPTGTGQSDVELRILALERKTWGPELGNLERRLAALEQKLWQGGGGSTTAVESKYAQVDTGGITAAAGNDLGQGNVILCSRSGSLLTPDGDTVPCYNAGGAVSAGKYISVQMVDGDWSTSVSPC